MRTKTGSLRELRYSLPDRRSWYHRLKVGGNESFSGFQRLLKINELVKTLNMDLAGVIEGSKVDDFQVTPF